MRRAFLRQTAKTEFPLRHGFRLGSKNTIKINLLPAAKQRIHATECRKLLKLIG
jgi:hypothetical protein